MQQKWNCLTRFFKFRCIWLHAMLVRRLTMLCDVSFIFLAATQYIFHAFCFEQCKVSRLGEDNRQRSRRARLLTMFLAHCFGTKNKLCSCFFSFHVCFVSHPKVWRLNNWTVHMPHNTNTHTHTLLCDTCDWSLNEQSSQAFCCCYDRSNVYLEMKLF